MNMFSYEEKDDLFGTTFARDVDSNRSSMVQRTNLKI
jgi:hypothetical protein